jgi:hypothetical protein
MNDDFLTPEQFLSRVLQICNKKQINMLEACVEYCNEHDIDVNEIVPLITRPMKEQIKLAAMESGLMKKEAQLEL